MLRVVSVLACVLNFNLAFTLYLGVYETPLVVIRSQSGRPILESITFRILPFTPTAISLVQVPIESANNTKIQYERTLYWSNIAQGVYSIQRCHIDGSQVETVVVNVSYYTILYCSKLIFMCKHFSV